MRKGKPPLHEPIEMRRLDGRIPQGSDGVCTLIVGKNEDDIRWTGRRAEARKSQAEAKHKESGHAHGYGPNEGKSKQTVSYRLTRGDHRA